MTHKVKVLTTHIRESSYDNNVETSTNICVLHIISKGDKMWTFEALSEKKNLYATEHVKYETRILQYIKFMNPETFPLVGFLYSAFDTPSSESIFVLARQILTPFNRCKQLRPLMDKIVDV